MKRREFTLEQTAEIDLARKTATNKKAVHDLEILSLYAHGVSVKQIGQKTGVDVSVISKLARAYQKQGLAMLSGYSYAAVERHTFTSEQTAEIEAAYNAAADARVANRLKILLLHARGEPIEKVAKAVGVGQTTVYRLVYEYKDKGLETVIRKSARCKLYNSESASDQAAMLRSMLDSAANKRAVRKIRALLLWAEGKSRKDIIEATGLSKTSIYNAIKEFQENGVAAINKESRKHPFAAPKYKFTDQQKAEIGALRGLVADKQAARKLEALWLRTEKKNLPEISAITGLHTQTVYKVIRKYHEQGLEAAIRDHRGRHAKTD